MMRSETATSAHILIVDDQDVNVLLLEDLLREAGYTNLRSVTDPRLALPTCVDFKPDLILLDLHMPHMDGFVLLERMKPLITEGTYLPILILTADITQEAKQRALSMGAKDFLTKPFDATEVLLRIGNLLETRTLHVQLRDENRSLEQKVRARTRDLEEARIEILARLAKASEFRDDITGRHTHRVGELAARLAAGIGLSGEEVELIRLAAPLHDVGKIGIPDHILLKPAALTSKEFEVMKTHTTIGAEILSGSQVPLLILAREIAFTHHEQWDGHGYPRGLSGQAIPLPGRIVAVADAYDSMTNDRPYRKARPVREAFETLRRGAGVQWDKLVVETFEDISGAQDSVHAVEPLGLDGTSSAKKPQSFYR